MRDFLMMEYEAYKIYPMLVLFADAKGRYLNVQSSDKQVFKVDIEGKLAVTPKSLSGKKVDLVCTGDAINVPPNFSLAERYFASTVGFKKGKNIGIEEGRRVEFKKSIIFSSVTNQPGSDKLYEIAREIAAFMNTDGGDLYCGVDDDGFVVGIENDLAALTKAVISGANGKTDQGWNYKATKDGFSQKLRNLIRFHLGDYASTLVADPEFLTDDLTGAVYVKVHVLPSIDEFIYLGAHENVYYRTGTSAVLLEGRTRERYARQRFYSTQDYRQPETKIASVVVPEDDATVGECQDMTSSVEVTSSIQPTDGDDADAVKSELPKWMDQLIFDKLGAVYCKACTNMTVIDWNMDEIKKYLGTYFPRSYVESYNIFSSYLREHKSDYDGRYQLSIFDFGCGTGGGTVGLLAAIDDVLPDVRNVQIKALDGNKYALRMFELVFNARPNRNAVQYRFDVVPVKIDDIYDLDVVTDVMQGNFDFIISLKAICELVSKKSFEQRNPYGHIIRSFMPKLSRDGIMCLVDVTTFNDVSKEWLPKMLGAGIDEAGARVVARNIGYSETYFVSHSRAKADKSKIAWRILKGN